MLSDERINHLRNRTGYPNHTILRVLNFLSDDDIVELVTEREWHEGWMPEDEHHPTGVQLRAFAPPAKGDE